jgi:hypothetical protein
VHVVDVPLHTALSNTYESGVRLRTSSGQTR